MVAKEDGYRVGAMVSTQVKRGMLTRAAVLGHRHCYYHYQLVDSITTPSPRVGRHVGKRGNYSAEKTNACWGGWVQGWCRDVFLFKEDRRMIASSVD